MEKYNYSKIKEKEYVKGKWLCKRSFYRSFDLEVQLELSLALFYAPKSGKELKQDIKSKTDEYYDETEKFIADAKVKAKDMMNDGKKRSEQLIANAKSKSEELLKNAERIFTEAKSKTGS